MLNALRLKGLEFDLLWDTSYVTDSEVIVKQYLDQIDYLKTSVDEVHAGMQVSPKVSIDSKASSS